MRIIFKTEDNGVAVIIPAQDVVIEDCIRDVPTGAKYKIVEDTDVPSDRDFRDAWEVSPDSTWSTK